MERDVVECPQYIFYTPTTISMSGTTGSGKTTLLFEILKYKDQLFKEPPHHILYCYSVWQDIFETKRKELGIEFHQGIPSEDTVDAIVDGRPHMIIFDDLMQRVVSDERVQTLFTQGSHHNNITVVYINQNLYAQGKCARTLSLNTHYLLLLKNARDVSQIRMLGTQIGLGKKLVEAYNDATAQAFGYLLIDLSPRNDSFQLKSSILPHQDTVVYI